MGPTSVPASCGRRRGKGVAEIAVTWAIICSKFGTLKLVLHKYTRKAIKMTSRLVNCVIVVVVAVIKCPLY